MKKATALLLTILMVFCISGCKKRPDNSSSGVSVYYETEYEAIMEGAETEGTGSAVSNPSGTSKPQSGNSNSQSNNPKNTRPNVDYTKLVPTYSNHEFEISAFWAPYDISVEGLQMYKDAGLNTLALINHSLDWDSDHQFYLGSNRTMTALKNAKKVGLDVIISYGDWIGGAIEGEGYYGETPFSKHDIYGDYKDIIVGINMCDEPKIGQMEIYSNDTLINDLGPRGRFSWLFLI